LPGPADEAPVAEHDSMTQPEELLEIARSIIDSNRYMTLATADETGRAPKSKRVSRSSLISDCR
jgi:hypothetical protein